MSDHSDIQPIPEAPSADQPSQINSNPSEDGLQEGSQTEPTLQILREGDPVVLMDRRRRETYLILRAGRTLNQNGNVIQHDDVIGLPDGGRVESKKGNPFKVFKATLQDHLLNMHRYATIIYPKDIAAILMHGDVGPNMRIVEGGLGSGALAMATLRAIGPGGHLTTYELREEAIQASQRNIAQFLGHLDHHEIKHSDIYEGITERHLDRILLDVPEPWRVVPHAEEALRDGGILVGYLPTILQVHELVRSLRDSPHFYTTWTLEVLERSWHVTEDSVRPDHRMTAHTGFLVFSRRSARWREEEGASKS